MRVFFCLLSVAVAATSCSSKDDPYATVSEFCAAWGKQTCSAVVVSNCSGLDASASLTQACVEKQQAFCEGLVPNTGYSSDQAQTCLNAVGTAYTDGRLSALEIDTVRHLGAPCNHLIKGPQATGQSCTLDAECDTVHNVQCVLKNGVGTCVVPTVVANGTSCAANGASCMPGFYCGDDNCIQSKAVNAKCTADFECETGLSCADADPATGATGTCTARVSQTACSIDSDCTTNVCDIAAGASTGKCVTSVILSSTESLCADLQK
jgi:hypothetical protein